MGKKNFKPCKSGEIDVKQGGMHLLQFKFNEKKGVTNQQIADFIPSFEKKVAEVMPDGYTAQIMINQMCDEPIMWQAGKFFDLGAEPSFYDFANTYEFDGEVLQGRFRRFNILVKFTKQG